LHELDTALDSAGLSYRIFSTSLCFYSFDHGFSKPDPHLFRLLTVRLRARGISPHEILMVGDRMNNDIAPARAQGWQAWHFNTQGSAPGKPEGNWSQLLRWLAEVLQ
jgi:FMN phosphatase YigB (HAD superfamily)